MLISEVVLQQAFKEWFSQGYSFVSTAEEKSTARLTGGQLTVMAPNKTPIIRAEISCWALESRENMLTYLTNLNRTLTRFRKF
jgi:hypothetical protein